MCLEESRGAVCSVWAVFTQLRFVASWIPPDKTTGTADSWRVEWNPGKKAPWVVKRHPVLGDKWSESAAHVERNGAETAAQKGWHVGEWFWRM